MCVCERVCMWMGGRERIRGADMYAVVTASSDDVI